MTAMALVRRQRHSVDDLDDAVLGHAIRDHNPRKAVHLDRGKAKDAGNIHADVSITKQRGQVVMLGLALVDWRLLLLAVRLIVKGISVERRVGRNVVLENGLQILAAPVSVEEEGVRPGPQPVEGLIGGDEDRAALEVDAVDELDKFRLLVRKQQRREAVREERDDAADVWGRNQDVIDSVDDAVLSCLYKLERRQMKGVSQSILQLCCTQQLVNLYEYEARQTGWLLIAGLCSAWGERQRGGQLTMSAAITLL